jgi:hypothetical protein
MSSVEKINLIMRTNDPEISAAFREGTSVSLEKECVKIILVRIIAGSVNI